MNIYSINSINFTGKPMVIGNMKMNKSPQETSELINRSAFEMLDLPTHNDIYVGFAPTALAFCKVKEGRNYVDMANIKLGGQEADLGIEKGGAVTGAISQDMYKEAGADFVIIGHSERRGKFAETDKQVNAKTLSALEKGLMPVVCVGESLKQREAGDADDVVSTQVIKALKNIKEEDITKVVIAYEPIWAINTGKTCDADEADRMCRMIRNEIAKIYGEQNAADVSILYGGSVNDSNADKLFAQSNIDGGLVGGACLDAEKFSKIVHSLVNQKS
ncbi:MAG TPA: triose-phosphate isomerase [Candidatus Gastranaerophilaceae bacterium]|nr:triose-phosphate isomerase [Candidatus Gastranaerophilaceae bacterium]